MKTIESSIAVIEIKAPFGTIVDSIVRMKLRTASMGCEIKTRGKSHSYTLYVLNKHAVCGIDYILRDFFFA